MLLQNTGNYSAHLTVTDSSGAVASASLPIVSGNEPPRVSIELAGNQQFYFQEVPVKYAVEVEDREDGLLSDGDISAESVGFSISMVEAGFDPDELDAWGRKIRFWLVFPWPLD